MLLSLLPVFCPQWRRQQTAIFCVGFGWALVVAISRIVMGAHYLTDTAVGLAVGLGSFVAISALLFPTRKKIGKGDMVK